MTELPTQKTSPMPSMSYGIPPLDDLPWWLNPLAKTHRCPECGSVREVCFRCEDPHTPMAFTLVPGYGQQDSRYAIRLCERCHNLLLRNVYLFLGNDSPIDEEGRWIKIQ